MTNFVFWPPRFNPMMTSNRRSLLSAALDKRKMRHSSSLAVGAGTCMSRSGSSCHSPGVGRSSQSNLDETACLSSSVRQTLLWDRCMPFNTRMDPSATHTSAVALNGKGAPSRPSEQSQIVPNVQSVPESSRNELTSGSLTLSWSQELGAYW
jgi:hypothetical protein